MQPLLCYGYIVDNIVIQLLCVCVYVYIFFKSSQFTTCCAIRIVLFYFALCSPAPFLLWSIVAHLISCPSVIKAIWTSCFVLLYYALFALDFDNICVFSCMVLFVSTSQLIGCEDCIQNSLDCAWCGVKLYFNSNSSLLCVYISWQFMCNAYYLLCVYCIARFINTVVSPQTNASTSKLNGSVPPKRAGHEKHAEVRESCSLVALHRRGHMACSV